MLAALCVSAARGQSADTGYVLRSPMYDINFSAKWKIVFQPTFLGKSNGSEGIAYVGCAPGTARPDVDSQAAYYSGILGGHITPGAAIDTVIGKYTVRRQTLNYDSLPRLDSMIQARSGFALKHKNGSLRVYTIVSGGYVFAVAGMATFPGAIAPYPDIERALVTLVLHPGAAVRPGPAAAGKNLWLRRGLLGGDWLKAHPPASVEAFDARGASAGRGIAAGDGTWVLPLSNGSFFVRINTLDGISLVLPSSD